MTCRAAFLDRDGVINHDSGYVHRMTDFVLLDGVPEALRLLSDAGYLLVIVTNQSGIARGYYTEEDFLDLTEEMKRLLARENVEIAHVSYCPHLPTDLQTDTPCACRKPLPGMLIEAASLLDIDLTQSIMIGDKPSDMAAGRAAGVCACLLIEPSTSATPSGTDAVFPDLLTCARSVMQNSANTDIAPRTSAAANRQAPLM